MTFDLQAKKFSLSNALFCAWLAREAYGDLPAHPAAGAIVITAPATDDLAFVWSDGAAVYVVVRGSRNMQNWIANFDAFRRRDKLEDSLHAGFWQGADGLWAKMKTAIATFDPHLPVVFIGHSRGASIAAILAYWYETIEPARFHSGYVFEPAKPGGKQFQKAFNVAIGERFFCITNAADIVPWVPLGFGYRRVGQEIFFPDAAVARGWWVNPSSLRKIWSDKVEFILEFWRLYSRRWTALASLGKSPMLADHPIDAVIARLNAAANAMANAAAAEAIQNWRESGA